MFERRDFLLAPRGTHCHRAMEEVLQHRTPSQCLGLSPTRTCKLDRSRMSFHPNTPAQFSAGVQTEPQLRAENPHNPTPLHPLPNPTYQPGLQRDAVQPDIEPERKKRDANEAGKSYSSGKLG